MKRRMRAGVHRVAVARARKPAPTPPWAGLEDTWYAELESNGSTYGLARRVPGPDGTAYEVLDRTTGAWIPSPLAGAGYFSEIGGVTDAVPVTADRAAELVTLLTEGAST